MEIHIQLAGVELGPYSEKQVRDYLAEGLLSMGDPAKLEGSPSWGTVTEILEKIAEQTIAVEPEGEADRVENVELSTSPEPEVEPKAEFVEEPGSASIVTPPEEPDMVEASALNLKGRNQHETVRIPMPQVIGSFARKGPPNIKVAPVLSVPEPDASTAPTSSISWKQAPIATTALFPSNFRVPAKKSDADSDTAPPSLPEPPPLAHQSPSTSSQPTDPVVQSDAVVRIIPKTTDTEIRRAPPPIPTVWPEPAVAEAASTASDQSPLPISAPADVVRVLSKKTDGKARALPPSVPAVGPEPTSTEGASATVARMPEPTVSPPTAVRIIPRNAEQESKSAVPLPSGKLPGMSSESLPSVVRALAKKTESPTNPPPAEAVKSEMTISKTLPTMARALANKSERTAKKSQPGHVPPLRASPEPISLPSVAEKAQEKTPSPDTSWAPATVIALPSKSSVVTPTSAPKGSGPPALPVAPPVQKDAGMAAPKSPLQSILLRKHALRNLIGLVLIVAGLAAFVILYVVFAYFSSSALQKALDDGNRDELAATVDFQAVRQSLKTQLEAQLGKPQVQDANFSAPPDSASFAVLSMIENSIDRYVTAEGISAFVKKTDQPTGPDQPQTMTPEVASSIFVELTSHPVVFEGLVSFNDFVIDRDVAKLHLQLYPSGWKLDRIELKSGLQFSSLSSPPAESIPSSPPASPPPEPAPAPGPESTPLPGPGAPAPPAPPTPSNANPAGSLTAPVVETYLDQGNAKLKQQDWDGAIANFNQVLVIDSKTTVAYFNRAMAKMGKGDADGAIADFSQAIELDPKLADAYLARGQAKLVQKDLDGAIADYTQAIIINPKLADAYMSRGDARTGKGDFDGAIADYTQLIQIDPNRANAYSNRGWARQAKNDLDGAILDFTQAISIDPKMAVAYYNRGLAHQAQGNLDAAILDFNQTLDLDPKRAGAYYNRGNAKNTKRDFEGAIADYNQAVALDPTIALAFCNRGLAKQARGDMDGALADYTQALTLDNTIAVAYYNRGLIKEQKSDLDGAIADSSHALDLEPKMAQAYYNRGFAKLAKGNLDGASIDLRKFCELVPRDHYSDHARLYLWLISKAEDPKANADDDLAHSLQEDWNSAPDDMVSKLAAFLLNRLSEDDLIAAAASDDVKKDQGQHCEVWYFVGMKRLLAEDRKVAYDDFQKCVATGEKDYCEYILAAAELQALDPSTKN